MLNHSGSKLYGCLLEVLKDAFVILRLENRPKYNLRVYENFEKFAFVRVWFWSPTFRPIFSQKPPPKLWLPYTETKKIIILQNVYLEQVGKVWWSNLVALCINDFVVATFNPESFFKLFFIVGNMIKPPNSNLSDFLQCFFI